MRLLSEFLQRLRCCPDMTLCKHAPQLVSINLCTDLITLHCTLRADGRAAHNRFFRSGASSFNVNRHKLVKKATGFTVVLAQLTCRSSMCFSDCMRSTKCPNTHTITIVFSVTTNSMDMHASTAHCLLDRCSSRLRPGSVQRGVCHNRLNVKLSPADKKNKQSKCICMH